MPVAPVARLCFLLVLSLCQVRTESIKFPVYHASGLGSGEISVPHRLITELRPPSTDIVYHSRRSQNAKRSNEMWVAALDSVSAFGHDHLNQPSFGRLFVVPPAMASFLPTLSPADVQRAAQVFTYPFPFVIGRSLRH